MEKNEVRPRLWQRLKDASVGEWAAVLALPLAAVIGFSTLAWYVGVKQGENGKAAAVEREQAANREIEELKVQLEEFTASTSSSSPASSSPTSSSMPPTGRTSTTTETEVRFDPSRDGASGLAQNSSRYFFDREFFIQLGEVASADEDPDEWRATELRLQQGTSEPCVFADAGSGRYFYRRGATEYEVTLDLNGTLGGSVNVAAWSGRVSTSEPCAVR